MKRYLFSFIVLNSCMVGPNYKEPENTISDSWQTDLPGISQNTPQIDWWKVFNDPLLDKYIEMAAANNKDLLTAEANILQARALRMVAASSLFPQVEANLNGTKTYFSKNGPVFAGNSLTAGPSMVTGLPFQIQIPQIQPLYNALLDASWELDLFGKTRRSVEAAAAQYESAIEDRNDILISVLGEIALNYIELRSSQKNKELIEKKIQISQSEVEIAKRRFEKGYTNKIDFDAIEANLASILAELPDIHSQIYKNIYTLSILTGHPPETLVEELFIKSPLPSPPEKIAIGVRSDLLRRRPDIRRSERQLALATANVGIAVASFFPSIVLSADAGFQALKLNKLFKWRSKTWDYGGNINIPIFEGGSLIGNLRANEAATNAALFVYENTVLKALEETESAIITFAEDKKTVHAFLKNVNALKNIKNITQKRLEKGIANLLEFLESEKQLISAKQKLLSSETKTLLDLITLYKALGGGWQPES